MTGAEFNIVGKDFLTEEEACFYCCVGRTKFRNTVMIRVPILDLCGRKVYRKSDLKAFMDNAPKWKGRES